MNQERIINGMVYGMDVDSDRMRKTYYVNGIVHCEDGPAIEYDDGTKVWKFNGQIHRDNGPAMEFNQGSKRWYHHGQLHRMYEPASIDPRGDKEWYRYGRRHREDGPAMSLMCHKYEAWYIDGHILNGDEVKLHQQNRIKNMSITLLSLDRLPPYVIFWILEWSESAYISELSQRSIIKMIEGIRNCRDKIKGMSGGEM